MQSTKLAVLLGHSHAGTLINGLADRDLAMPSATGPLHVAIFESWNYGGFPPYLVKRPDDGQYAFNLAVLQALDRAMPGMDDRVFLTFFGGNEHSVISLVRNAEPFDFVLPEAPDLPLTPGVELVPCSYVAKVLYQLMELYLLQLYLLRQTVSDPIFAFEPPPVNGDDSYVLPRLDQFFLEDTDIRELAPRSLRLKMRLLQRRLLAKICTDNNVTLLPPPPACQTPEGFIIPSCYGADATHAGGTYGGRLLLQVEGTLGRTLRSFSKFSC